MNETYMQIGLVFCGVNIYLVTIYFLSQLILFARAYVNDESRKYMSFEAFNGSGSISWRCDFDFDDVIGSTAFGYILSLGYVYLWPLAIGFITLYAIRYAKRMERDIKRLKRANERHD